MHKRSSFYLDTNDIRYKKKHYAFRQKKNSTIDEKESVITVFLDLLEAFDTIDHNILEFYWKPWIGSAVIWQTWSKLYTMEA